jgi:hypothetical protein
VKEEKIGRVKEEGRKEGRKEGWRKEGRKEGGTIERDVFIVIVRKRVHHCRDLVEVTFRKGRTFQYTIFRQ